MDINFSIVIARLRIQISIDIMKCDKCLGFSYVSNAFDVTFSWENKDEDD